jgi:hypothetical protein
VSKILEAVAEERSQLQADFESKLAVLDEIEQRVKCLDGGSPPNLAKTPASAKSREPRKKSHPKPPGKAGRRPDLSTREARKQAILECLADEAPEVVASLTLRNYVGVKDKKTLRGLIEELIGEGKVIKTGERAGTRYGLKNAAVRSDRPERSAPGPTAGGELFGDELKVLRFLETQSHPQSVALIALKTHVPAPRVKGAVNRLINQEEAHMVRIGVDEAFEVVK